jgi:hypothetical protein
VSTVIVKTEDCINALTTNGFEVFFANTPNAAKEIFFNQILPNLPTKTMSWGDSMTLDSTGVLTELQNDKSINTIKTFEAGVARSEIIERRRQALLSDLFLTGSNAITECGKLVNLDMIGNRIGGISFGPKNVVIFAGTNKIVPNIESAFKRIRNISAPLNAKRHLLETPCVKTGKCHDCNSPQRICNSWSIIDKCYPKKRIKIVLIDEALGL